MMSFWPMSIFSSSTAYIYVSSSKALGADVERARVWIVNVGLELSRRAAAHNDYVTAYLDKVETVAACAELPGDMPLRIRCLPNVFNLRV